MNYTCVTDHHERTEVCGGDGWTSFTEGQHISFKTSNIANHRTQIPAKHNLKSRCQTVADGLLASHRADANRPYVTSRDNDLLLH